MSKKRGLGKGLDALLVGINQSFNENLEEAIGRGDLKELPIEYLQPCPFQPRKTFDPEALDELANSIRAQGIIQPIIARKKSTNRYEIIAGERRWRAAQLAGLQEVPVLVRDIPDEAAIAMALIENIQREDLNPLEEARALHRLIEEFGMTHESAAESVGKNRVTVSNLLRLLALNTDVKTMLEHGDIEMGHARALLSLDSDKQHETARLIVANNLSVRETENLVRRLLAGNKKKDSKFIVEDPDVRDLQNKLSGKLGAKVLIQHNAKGKGKLVVSFNSLDELDGILKHIS